MATAATVGLLMPGLIPAFATLAPILGLILVRRRLRVGILSPVSIVVMVLSVVGFFGYLLAIDLEGLDRKSVV